MWFAHRYEILPDHISLPFIKNLKEIEMNKYLKIASVFFSLLLCLSAAAYGQETTGSIEGTVTDPNGARVAGAAVELVSVSFRRTVTGDDNGFFRAL